MELFNVIEFFLTQMLFIVGVYGAKMKLELKAFQFKPCYLMRLIALLQHC